MGRGESAVPAPQDPEEGLNVLVGADVAVGVEVGGAAGWAAVAAEAREEGLDVSVGAGVAVVVEVGGDTGDELAMLLEGGCGRRW